MGYPGAGSGPFTTETLGVLRHQAVLAMGLQGFWASVFGFWCGGGGEGGGVGGGGREGTLKHLAQLSSVIRT